MIQQNSDFSQASSKPSENEAFNALLGNTTVISSTGTKTVKKQTVLHHSQTNLREAKVVSKRTGKPHRILSCQVNPRFGVNAVTIKLNQDDIRSRASFGGLQNCGCVWGCPVCAPRIAAEKGEFILKALKWGEQSNQTPVMLALTARHHKGMTLEGFKTDFKAAWTTFNKHRTWRNFIERFGITHWIANREVTHGENGWHYHMHMILFIDNKAAAAAEASNIQSEMEALWIHCLEARGLDALPGIALKVSAHGNVGKNYLTKIGLTVSEETGKLEYELTGQGNKDGYSIWDILRHSYHGDEKSTLLYIEFVIAMSGENFITSSHGLKKLTEGIVLDDEAAAADAEPRDMMRDWAAISPYWWSIIIRTGASDKVLETAAMTRSVSEVRTLLWRLQDELINCGELPEAARHWRTHVFSSKDFPEGIRLIE